MRLLNLIRLDHWSRGWMCGSLLYRGRFSDKNDEVNRWPKVGKAGRLVQAFVGFGVAVASGLHMQIASHAITVCTVTTRGSSP